MQGDCKGSLGHNAFEQTREIRRNCAQQLVECAPDCDLEGAVGAEEYARRLGRGFGGQYGGERFQNSFDAVSVGLRVWCRWIQLREIHELDAVKCIVDQGSVGSDVGLDCVA